MPRVENEICRMTPLGFFGLDQVRWAGSAGAVWEFWRWAPCCGAPDCYGVTCCIFHWTLLGPCSMCKLYASSLGDPVAVWPHCFCVLCCPLARLFTRYNLRSRNGTQGNIIGDCCCVFLCCGPCACCQELRSVSTNFWSLFLDGTKCTCYVPGCRFLR